MMQRMQRQLPWEVLSRKHDGPAWRPVRLTAVRRASLARPGTSRRFPYTTCYLV